MSVINASSLEDGETEWASDVCIVGAGAAGIYLAVRLADRGLDVVVLEAGGRVCEDGETFGVGAEFAGTPYRGAHEGRAFGLGGTTSRWGGVLVPHTDHDHRPVRDDAFDPWRYIVDVVATHSDVVLDTMDLSPTLDGKALAQTHIGTKAEIITSSGLGLQIAQYLPFRRTGIVRQSANGVAECRSRRLGILTNARRGNAGVLRPDDVWRPKRDGIGALVRRRRGGP
jgi:glycine/D-amino acid oxidase-like deaminating enzyme